MSDSTLNLELPLDKGTVYTRADGRSAEILSTERHSKTREVLGVNVRITQDGKEPIHALIRLGDLMSWQLQKPEAAPVGAHRDTPSVDEDLTATAQLIANLRADLAHATALVDQKNREIEELEAENEHLTETRDSAVDHDAAASDNYEERAQEFVEIVNDLRAKNVNLALSLGEKSKKLTDALAELASLKSSTPVTPAADATVAPIKEYKIVFDAKESEMEKLDREGWQIQHIEFLSSLQYTDVVGLHIVYYRFCQPSPIAPEPLRTSVKPVGPTITIIPEVRTERPRFDAETYMADMLADCKKAAEEAIADQLPAYQAILNPRPLTLGVGNPVKPEVR